LAIKDDLQWNIGSVRGVPIQPVFSAKLDRWHFAALTSLTLNTPQATNEHLALLRKLVDIDELRIESANNQVTDEGLSNLSCMKLDALMIVGAANLTDTGLRQLNTLTLSALQVDGSQITDDALRHLPLARITHLYLADTKVTDAGAALIGQSSGLRWLGLEGTAVTDEGLAHLRELKNLEVLKLNRTQLTDAGLAHLEGLPKLQSLRAVGTRITKSGLEKLRQARPELNVKIK
jgi:hypothetical protein